MNGLKCDTYEQLQNAEIHVRAQCTLSHSGIQRKNCCGSAVCGKVRIYAKRGTFERKFFIELNTVVNSTHKEHSLFREHLLSSSASLLSPLEIRICISADADKCALCCSTFIRYEMMLCASNEIFMHLARRTQRFCTDNKGNGPFTFKNIIHGNKHVFSRHLFIYYKCCRFSRS